MPLTTLSTSNATRMRMSRICSARNPMVGRFAGRCASVVSGYAARDAGRLSCRGISAELMPASGQNWMDELRMSISRPGLHQHRVLYANCDSRVPFGLAIFRLFFSRLTGAALNMEKQFSMSSLCLRQRHPSCRRRRYWQRLLHRTQSGFGFRSRPVIDDHFVTGLQ